MTLGMMMSLTYIIGQLSAPVSSFIGFAPADDPEVLAIAIIHNPQGVYYGGQVAAPVVRQLFENVLPYLDKMDYN